MAVPVARPARLRARRRTRLLSRSISGGQLDFRIRQLAIALTPRLRRHRWRPTRNGRARSVSPCLSAQAGLLRRPPLLPPPSRRLRLSRQPHLRRCCARARRLHRPYRLWSGRHHRSRLSNRSICSALRNLASCSGPRRIRSSCRARHSRVSPSGRYRHPAHYRPGQVVPAAASRRAPIHSHGAISSGTSALRPKPASGPSCASLRKAWWPAPKRLRPSSGAFRTLPYPNRD